MSWFHRLVNRASLTFTLEQSERISQPKTLMDISYLMSNWAYQNAPQDALAVPHRFPVEIDGYTDGMIGTINWYIPNGINPDDIRMYAEQCIQEELMPLGIQAHIGRLDQSGMYDYKVWRIEVTRNETQNFTQIPEMNLANSNAAALLRTIGIDVEHDGDSGSMDLYEVKSRLDNVLPFHIQENLRETTVGDEPGKAQFINFGMDADRMNRYLASLRQIVEFGLTNGFRKLQWA